MRIAFVSLMANSSWGASEALWADAARRALRAGHNVLVSVYERDESPAAIDQLRREGAIVHFRPLDGWVRRSALLSRLTGVFRSVRNFQPDIICINQGGTYDIGRGGSTGELRRTIEKLGVPFVLLCHCEQGAPTGRKLRHSRRAFQDAAIVGVLANRLKALSEEHLSVSLANARVFHNPVNPSRTSYIAWPGTSYPLRFAFIGRLEPVKNLGALLEVLSSETWRHRDWSLTVCGVGAERHDLERMSESYALTDKVHFAGYVEDIAGLWTTHHALVMPSRLEGVPLAMLEAMLCGRPVVATNIGGISEWLQGSCGFLIERPDPSELARTLEHLWDQRDNLELLGRNAHAVVSSKLDPDPARTLVEWLIEKSAPGCRT